ncbi:MAG: T9SS type A sorting domain-containing protein [Bacteroidia bacterium]
MTRKSTLFRIASLALIINCKLSIVDCVAQSIPNNSFENWASTTWMDPQYYQSSNDPNYGNGPQTPNVIRVTQAYHGNYAVQETCIVSGGDTMAGYIVDGNPNGNKVSGGIPYSQIPTGLRIYYKYTVKQRDSAAIIVWFKNADTVTAIREALISDTTSTYTLFAATFSPAVTVAPDSIVVAIVTSSNIMNNGSGRAGSVLTFDSLTFTGVSSQPAELNGDFENWFSDSSLWVNDWESYNYSGLQRTTDAFTGKYALELTTQGINQNNNQNEAGEADDGTRVQISQHNDSTEGGYPYSQQMDTLIFAYKYAPADTGDRAQVNLQFNKNSKNIFWSGASLKAASSYTITKIPFNIGSVPDSVIIQLQSSQYNGDSIPSAYVGSVLKIDDLYFASQNIADDAQTFISTLTSIPVYPNPTKDVFNVDLRGFTGKLEKITVYDITGKVVDEKNYFLTGSKTGIETFDISNYSEGLYMVRINTDKGIQYQKVSKVQ